MLFYAFFLIVPVKNSFISITFDDKNSKNITKGNGTLIIRGIVEFCNSKGKQAPLNLTYFDADEDPALYGRLRYYYKYNGRWIDDTSIFKTPGPNGLRWEQVGKNLAGEVKKVEKEYKHNICENFFNIWWRTTCVEYRTNGELGLSPSTDYFVTCAFCNPQRDSRSRCIGRKIKLTKYGIGEDEV